MKFDENVRYLKSHEWARKEGELFTVGISDYAQDSLGDVVFVEFPEKGKRIPQGEAFGVVESVKAASDVYMPLAGTVEELNEALEDSPETINSDPFGGGWIIKIRAENPSEYDQLMTAADYEEYTKELDD
jgi:glycine cleavage system H protein